MRKRKVTRRQRGQSLIEFAISLTFMITLLAGVVDLGRAYFVFITLRDAAQEGAMYGSIEPTDVTGIKNRVVATSDGLLDLGHVSMDKIGVKLLPEGTAVACAGYGIEISVTYDFTLVAPFLGGRSLPLKAIVTDTILQPPC